MTRKLSILGVFIVIACCLGCVENSAADSLPREKEKFDFDWKFSKGDFPDASRKDFDDSQWQQLDVPHDWSISDTFSEDNPTGRSGGYASGGVAWYRKNFTLNDKDASSIISIEFGGVYENSEVWVNGQYLGKRPFGYISFNYDLTPYLNLEGENVIAVRVDNSKQPNARWYTGSGIYRHVWLITTNKLHIARHGIFATARKIDANSAVLEVRTTIENNDDEKQFTLLNQLYSEDNEMVARFESTAGASRNSKEEIVQILTVDSPELWSPDDPNLYRLTSAVKVGDEIVDEVNTTIGIREFRFSAGSGFSLNGTTGPWSAGLKS